MNYLLNKITKKRAALLFVVAFALAGCARPASVGLPTLAPSTPAPPTPTKPPATAVPPQQPAATAIAVTPLAPTQIPPPATPTPLPPQPTVAAPAPAPTFPPYLLTPAPGDANPPGSECCAQNPPPKPPASGCHVYYYTVRPGDNLFRIGLRYNTTAYAIARQNGIPDVRLINPGRRLKITVCN